MDIKELSINSIKPYANNPRRNDGAVDAVAASIKEFGFQQPLVIDRNGVIVVGHTRFKAAKKLGYETVPCVVADDLTEEQINAYRLADNKTNELAEWDAELLEAEIENIPEIDMVAFGFQLSEAVNEVVEDSYNETEKVEPRAKLGDIWQLGNHRLMCGDSTSITAVNELLGGHKVDMVFTDPPYNLETKGGCKGEVGKALKKQGREIEFISNFEPKEFLNILPLCFDGNMNAYVFCNKELLPTYLNWAVDNNYSYNVLIWKKPSAIPIADSHRPDIEYLILFRKRAIWNNSLKGINYSRCLEYSREKRTKENGNHPTIKPLGLIANELMISSNKGSIVLDFFGGSGSTLIACEQTGRKCLMMELDPYYADVIIDRWEQFTGKKAALISSK